MKRKKREARKRRGGKRLVWSAVLGRKRLKGSVLGRRKRRNVWDTWRGEFGGEGGLTIEISVKLFCDESQEEQKREY